MVGLSASAGLAAPTAKPANTAVAAKRRSGARVHHLSPSQTAGRSKLVAIATRYAAQRSQRRSARGSAHRRRFAPIRSVGISTAGNRPRGVDQKPLGLVRSLLGPSGLVAEPGVQ